MRHTLHYPVLLVCLSVHLSMTAMPYAFSCLDASDGLSDNQVQHILQLPDGRMAFTTLGNINLYDGMRFHYIHRNDSDVYAIKDYHGHYHVYVGRHDRLWVKDYGKVWCLDLRHERYLKNPGTIFLETGVREKVTDLFLDSEKDLWLVTPKGVWEAKRKRYLLLPKDAGELQDVEVSNHQIYLFFSYGEVICYSRDQGRQLYRKAAYPEEERANYSRTSLVVKGPDGNFYQVRSGRKSGLFVFSPQSCTWRQLLETRSPLHTLIVPSRDMAYISSLNGIWAISLSRDKVRFQSSLHTTDGKQLQTDVNTIYQDRQQGIWLGTANRGILYTHPERFKFVSAPTLEELPLAPQDRRAAISHKLPAVFQGQSYNDLYTDRKGRTWAATPDGLRLFLPCQAAFRTFYTEDGLPNNFIHAVTEDGRGQIWVSTSDGISRVSVNEKADSAWFTNYRHEDGTLKGEYRNQEVQTLSDGRILMGGVDGWTLFHPDSVEIPRKDFSPLLVGLSLYGEPMRIASADSMNSFSLLSQAPPYVRHFEFDYRQNHIGFDFSALNYAWPTHTYYRYRLVHGGDSTWHAVRPQSNGGIIDHKGNLHLAFSLLPPGNYRLDVMASTQSRVWNGPVTEITFIIHAPWWLSGPAYAAYVFLFLFLAVAATRLYVRQAKHRILRRHKEDILLLRVQHLIERCDNYERQVSMATASCASPKKEEPSINPADSDFLNKAVELVEAHLNTPGYTVEQLSRDLCMERSGLYKKLSALIDKSPSLFIRSVRLGRAAELIRKGGMNMAEIAERVGFSSASYMSKCFQEEFGCKPSEYVGKEHNST